MRVGLPFLAHETYSHTMPSASLTVSEDSDFSVHLKTKKKEKRSVTKMEQIFFQCMTQYINTPVNHSFNAIQHIMILEFC